MLLSPQQFQQARLVTRTTRMGQRLSVGSEPSVRLKKEQRVILVISTHDNSEPPTDTVGEGMILQENVYVA
jgi:hypothetical protein